MPIEIIIALIGTVLACSVLFIAFIIGVAKISRDKREKEENSSGNFQND